MPSSKRRPKGEGSITVLPSGKVRIRVELDPVDGKRQWLSATADTKKEAVEKLKKLQRDKEDNVLRIRAAEDTIEYQSKEYLKHLEAQGLAGSTLVVTNRALRYLNNAMGDIHISHITSKDIDKMLLEWKKKKYTNNTYLSYLGRLQLFFAWCVEQNLIRKSPIGALQKTPKSNKPKHEVVVLSQQEHEQIKTYLKTLWVDRAEKRELKYKFLALYCLAYETGMREGEILALTWDCLDEDNNTVTVCKTLAKSKEDKFIISSPKTQSGFRTIKISEQTTKLLLELKPISFDISPYIFYNKATNNFYTAINLTHAWEITKKGAGITRPFTFHGIRHTNASNMIYKNIPIALIAQRLGHSSIAVTYGTYGHILQECEEKNIAVIEA